MQSALTQHASPKNLMYFGSSPRLIHNRMRFPPAAILPRPGQSGTAILFLIFVISFLSPRMLAASALVESLSPDVFVSTQGQIGKLCLSFKGKAPSDGTRLKRK